VNCTVLQPRIHAMSLQILPQSVFHYYLNSEGGFLDRGEELPPFSPVLPARGPPYADEDIDSETCASPLLYTAPLYTEAQVSGQTQIAW
jgi:hypothetical protein